MAKEKKLFQCASCGATYPQWQGNCSSCNAWNSLEEKAPLAETGRGLAGLSTTPKNYTKPVPLSSIKVRKELRFSSGFAEFDRVLGGGLVAGSLILIGGNPGAGKSTLLLQSMSRLSRSRNVCYVSGEESTNQIVLHAIRLGLEKEQIMLLAENNLEKILAAVNETKPGVLVIDSIQTIYSSQQSSVMGGVAQVRECATFLMEYAKKNNCVVFLVGHVTKEGTLAGPRVLEHIVDTSLLLESTDDAKFRTIRANKNRFGAVNEIGVFAMTDKGMREVVNPSAIFMSHSQEPAVGSSTAIVHEGSRQLMVEIQVLIDNYTTMNPRRVSVGLDSSKMALLMAILGCHGGFSLANNNVFLNIVGGLRVEETATDLPAILALVSMASKRHLPQGLASFGELGLTGEIRPSPYGHERVKSALRMGMKQVLIPRANDPKNALDDNRVLRAGTLSEAINLVFPASAKKKASA